MGTVWDFDVALGQDPGILGSQDPGASQLPFCAQRNLEVPDRVGPRWTYSRKTFISRHQECISRRRAQISNALVKAHLLRRFSGPKSLEDRSLETSQPVVCVCVCVCLCLFLCLCLCVCVCVCGVCVCDAIYC